MSKCFGFAQFSSLQDAQNFVEMHFPFVRLPPPSFVSSTVSEDEDRSRRVKIDYSQSANPDAGSYRTVRPHRPPGHGGETNDGTRDIGSAHVPVILLRGLDVSSIPDTIAEALRSSEGPGKRSAKGLKRVVLIRDRVSKISLGIAFVEFVDVKVRIEWLLVMTSKTHH
jgi:RNA-binding protein 5/10